MPAFHVRIEGNVQELLMDAYRRIDEGEKARKASRVIENELCFACPAVRTCSTQVRKRYLKNDICLWRELAAMQDEDFDKVRNARLLYRSQGDEERPDLDALLDEGVYHGLGTRMTGKPGSTPARVAPVKKPVAHQE